MSTIRTYTFQEVQAIKIETCNNEEIEKLENAIISSIELKLEKLNVLIKNANVFSHNDFILVNDRYNTCGDLIQIAVAFGLDIRPIQCSLRGKNYLITDKLLETLKQFEKQYDFGKNVANQQVTESVRNIIDSYQINNSIDQEVVSMIRNIKKNGNYVTTQKRTVYKTYYDGRLINQTNDEWVSDANNIREKLIKISKDAEEKINNTNAQLRDGTTKLIYARARQMGYAVQEIKKGNQVQLVLVRN